MYHHAERMNDLAESRTTRELVGNIRGDVTRRRRLPRAWADEPLFAGFGSLAAIIEEISTMSPASHQLVVALMSPTAADLPRRSDVLLCGLAPIAIDKTADRARIGQLLTELSIITAGTETPTFSMHAAHGLVSRAMARCHRERRRDLYRDETCQVVADPTAQTTTPSTVEDEALTVVYLETFRHATAHLAMTVDLDDILASSVSTDRLDTTTAARMYRWRRKARPIFDQLTAA